VFGEGKGNLALTRGNSDRGSLKAKKTVIVTADGPIVQNQVDQSNNSVYVQQVAGLNLYFNILIVCKYFCTLALTSTKNMYDLPQL
jgi:hypothetical protein